MSWFSNQWDRLSKAFDGGSSQGGADIDAPIHDLEVSWGRERLRLSFAPRCTLSTLRSELSQRTGIPPDAMKLIYHGLILRGDPSTPLASYGLASGSRLVLVGNTTVGDGIGQASYAKGTRGEEQAARAKTKGEALAEEKKRREEDRTEAGVTGRIKDVVERARKELEPQLVEFEGRVGGGGGESSAAAAASERPAATPAPTAATATSSAPAPSATAPPSATGPSGAASPSSTSLSQTHRLLNELLSRSLLELDAIPAVSETTRSLRKEAVRTVQGFIDRLDGAWEKVGEEEKKKGAGTTARG